MAFEGVRETEAIVSRTDVRFNQWLAQLPCWPRGRKVQHRKANQTERSLPAIERNHRFRLQNHLLSFREQTARSKTPRSFYPSIARPAFRY